MEVPTGNQQRKVMDSEHGWVAGFFDGEGSVILSIRTRKPGAKGPKVQAMCKLQATDTPSLDKLVDILTCAGLAYHVSWSQPKGFTKRTGDAYRLAWTINIVGLRRTGRFLEWIVPLLATKREKALLCLDYIRSRMSHSNPQEPVTEAEIAIVAKMRTLNDSKKPWSLAITPETLAARQRWPNSSLRSETARSAPPSEGMKIQSALT